MSHGEKVSDETKSIALTGLNYNNRNTSKDAASILNQICDDEQLAITSPVKSRAETSDLNIVDLLRFNADINPTGFKVLLMTTNDRYQQFMMKATDSSVILYKSGSDVDMKSAIVLDLRSMRIHSIDSPS